MSEGTGEEEAAEEADTELKTKTPHVNVGKKSSNDSMATHGFRIPKCELLRPVAAFSSDAKVKLGAGSSFGGPTHLDEVTMATMACWTWHRFNVIQCLQRNLGFAEDMDL